MSFFTDYARACRCGFIRASIRPVIIAYDAIVTIECLLQLPSAATRSFACSFFVQGVANSVHNVDNVDILDTCIVHVSVVIGGIFAIISIGSIIRTNQWINTAATSWAMTFRTAAAPTKRASRYAK